MFVSLSKPPAVVVRGVDIWIVPWVTSVMPVPQNYKETEWDIHPVFCTRHCSSRRLGELRFLSKTVPAPYFNSEILISAAILSSSYILTGC